MPDISDVAMEKCAKDRVENIPLKRERDIDLNMRVSVDESDSSFKRPKLEEESTLTDVSSDNGYWNLNKPVIMNEPVSLDNNGDLDINIPQVEAESDLSGMMGSQKTFADNEDTVDHLNDKLLVEKLDVPNVQSQNGDVARWITVARHSWLQNCEFLQDCAIRLLCVLSLDRYNCCALPFHYGYDSSASKSYINMYLSVLEIMFRIRLLPLCEKLVLKH